MQMRRRFPLFLLDLVFQYNYNNGYAQYLQSQLTSLFTKHITKLYLLAISKWFKTMNHLLFASKLITQQQGILCSAQQFCQLGYSSSVQFLRVAANAIPMCAADFVAKWIPAGIPMWLDSSSASSVISTETSVRV